MSMVKPHFVASIASLTIMMTSITFIVQLLHQMGILLTVVEEHHKHRLLCMRAQKKITKKIKGERDESSTNLATSRKGEVADVPLP